MITKAKLQGHWDRLWIKAPGVEDHTTRVHWMQAGRDFADVRIPAKRPDLTGLTSLSELSAPDLHMLAQTEGFAGHVTLDADTCTWHREINWHGISDSADIGQISFDAEGRMVEAGVLADYTELWEQRATAPTQATRFSGGGYQGLFVTDGTLGVLGIGTAEKPATKPVLAALANGDIAEDTAALFDGLHALCRVEGDTVIATLATQPFSEGTPVLRLTPDAVTWHKTGFDGARTDLMMQTKTQSA